MAKRTFPEGIHPVPLALARPDICYDERCFQSTLEALGHARQSEDIILSIPNPNKEILDIVHNLWWQNRDAHKWWLTIEYSAAQFMYTYIETFDAMMAA